MEQYQADDARRAIAKPRDVAYRTDEVLKLVMVGEAAAGKTTALECLMNGGYPIAHAPDSTIGVGWREYAYHSDQGHYYRFSVHDTAGEERFAYVTEPYLRDAHVVVGVVDIAALAEKPLQEPADITAQRVFTRTFGAALSAARRRDKLVFDGFDHRPVMVCMGNKRDTCPGSELRAALRALCSRDRVHYLDTSARTGEHVVDAFHWGMCDAARLVEQHIDAHGVPASRRTLAALQDPPTYVLAVDTLAGADGQDPLKCRCIT